MMKRIAIFVVLALVASMAIITSLLEGRHYYRMRHLAGYGLHIDVVLGNSEIGRRDMYYARLWNLSAQSLYIEGCRSHGDYEGEGVMYRWDVQRWNAAAQTWESLRGADHWVPTPFGGYSNEEKCAKNAVEMTRVRPLEATVLGWVYKDWVTTGEPVRMAIHTSLSRPPSQQPILYTNTFVVNRKLALPPVENF